MVKNYLQFINEADAPPPAPAPQAPPAQPPAQPAPAAQPPAQPAQSGSTQNELSAQEPAPQGQSTEEKSGDLSNYNNEGATKFPDTVKKMVDLIKDLDKEQLIKLRTLIAELKSINDAKAEIGKL